MPLQFSEAFVPLIGGIEQGLDRRVLPPGALLALTNGQFTKAGAIDKRHGFTPMSRDTITGGYVSSARVLASTGTELVVVGKDRLWAYNPTQAKWVDRGPVSPITGKVDTTLAGHLSYESCDMTVSGNLSLVAAATFSLHSYGVNERSLVVAVSDVDGAKIGGPWESYAYTDVNINLQPHDPRCCNATGKMLTIFMQGHAAGARSICVLESLTATPTVAPVAPGTLLVNTARCPGGRHGRSYDAISLASGDYAFAYIENATGDVIVERRTPAHAVAATVTINTHPDYDMVALTESAGVLYVLTHADTGVGVAEVDIHAHNSTTLVAAWGPIALQIPALGEVPRAMGVVRNTTSARVCCIWSLSNDAIDNTNTASVYSRSTNLAGGALDALVTTYSAGLLSRPFVQNGVTYAILNSSSMDLLFEHQWIASFDFGAATRQIAEFHGVYNIGLGAYTECFYGFEDIGSAQNVLALSASSWVTAGLSIGLRRPVLTDTYYLRGNVDVARLEFHATVTAASTHRGTLAFGGGFVGWYAGTCVEELCHTGPPTIARAAAANVGGAVPLGTYHYVCVWETVDEAGIIHRSVPSRAERVIIAGVNDAAEIEIRSMPSTRRLHPLYVPANRRASAAIYRAGDDGVYKRVVLPWGCPVNTSGANSLTPYTDDEAAAEGDVLYTSSGEIEAACPDGARYMAVVGERLWVWGFFRRNRVQWSKRFTPGTASETARAPELNEGFGYLTPDGAEVTGVAELNGNAIVLSTSTVYALAGQGPEDDGSNNDFSGLQLVSNDVGCIEPRSVVSFPDGVLFMSNRGMMLIDNGHAVSAMDGASDILAAFPTVTSAVLVPKKMQVRFTAVDEAGLVGVIVVYDYRLKAWSRWNVVTSWPIPFVSACMHNDVYHATDEYGYVYYEDQTTWKDTTIAVPPVVEYVPLTIESAWLQPQQDKGRGVKQGGWQRVRHVTALCERKAPHKLTVRLDHDFDVSAPQSNTWTNATIAAWPELPREQPKMHVMRQKCQAVKITIQDAEDGVGSGEGYTVAGFSLLIGQKPGLARVAPTQRN